MDNKVDVKIADEVVAAIAGLAATEVDGVASLTGNLTHDVIAKQNTRSLAKGVALNIKGKEVAITLSLVIKEGCSIKDVSQKVQDKVKNSVQNMTGFTVSTVHIHISGMEIA